MQVKIFLKYILGYLNIDIEGYYIERFINICKNRKILIWNLKKETEVKLSFNIGIKDFFKLRLIARKTKCRIKIKKRKGIPFLLNRYKKRKIFLALLILVCLGIYQSSNYIWNIDIQMEEGKEIENIIEDLNLAGLKIGSSKRKIDTKEIINTLRLNRDDISWIGIDIKGTNAIIKIVKADETPKMVDENDYCNIVADKSGIITKIIAQNGTAQVKVGDTVTEGTVLISGSMEGKYTGIRYVHSIGEVEAKVWYTKTQKISYKQEEKVKTGKTEEKYRLKINNFEINFYKTLSNFEIYDTIEVEKKFKIFSNLYLPISLVKVENEETISEERNYTLEETIEFGTVKLEKQLESEIENLDNIIRKKCYYPRKRRLCRDNSYIRSIRKYRN
jgi:similar to stage IV sporulation protein